MDCSTTLWSTWCYLCAKKDSGEVDIELPACEDANMRIKEALPKHFGLITSSADLKPNKLCQDCYSLISSLVGFNKHVERVQEMYNFLVDNCADESCNLQAIRMKFDVCNGNTGQWYRFKTLTNHGVCEPIKSNEIQQEELYNEFSEHEENYENISKEDRFSKIVEYCTIERLDGHEFDTMTEDSVCGDDDETIECKANNETLVQDNEVEEVDTAETSNQADTKRRTTPNYFKKKPMVGDFSIDIICLVCEQKFHIFSHYCEHMEVTHDSTVSEKSCPFCSRKLQTWYHLGRHLRTHMPVESRYPYKCSECDRRFTTDALLEIHLKHKHRNEKSFICEVCGVTAVTKHSLMQHMYVHSDDAPYECEVCKKRFKKSISLNFHMDVHGPNKFGCTMCGLELNSRATLRKHFLVHSDKKQHECDLCGASFKRSRNLKDHLLSHTRLTPYECNFCDLAFSTRQPCRTHMTKVHPEELASMEASGNMAYTKNVPTLANLKEAVKTANNLKPVGKICNLKCSVCDRKFAYRSSRLAHIKVKHPNEYLSHRASSSGTYLKPTIHLQSE